MRSLYSLYAKFLIQDRGIYSVPKLRARSSQQRKSVLINFMADSPTLKAIKDLIAEHAPDDTIGGRSHSIRKGLQAAAAQLKERG